MESTEDNADAPGLSAEQADTDRLLRQLLGTAIADRYADFCRLASGMLPLTVSRPLAGHALRELDSLIRDVLAVPMEAQAVDDDEQAKRRRKARRMLKKMGFPDGAVQRAGEALKPTISHRTQIEKIVVRLGLAPDSDVAKLWINLTDTHGRVHERSFHERLEVDETFRAQYARRFDTVIRALAVQLQGRYAALMRRAKAIAGMPPAKGIKLFVSEIPGAPQLHGYFYNNLQSEEWLPFLEKEGLLKEPLSDVRTEGGLPIWQWPVGRYLVRMASSNNAHAKDRGAGSSRARLVGTSGCAAVWFGRDCRVASRGSRDPYRPGFGMAYAGDRAFSGCTAQTHRNTCASGAGRRCAPCRRSDISGLPARWRTREFFSTPPCTSTT